ncbi:MAG: GNAT family N-acetyltransferase [Calditrichia bacterium]
MATTGYRTLRFAPLSRGNWNDFKTLLGERGACGGCWCMWWRLKRSVFNQQKGAGNKAAMKLLMEQGHIPGILAYRDGKPVGWCSVAPRQEFTALERSRILKPIDEKPVWSVVCFFIDKANRSRGVTVQLLEATIRHVKRQGGKIIEGYPVEPKTERIPDVFAFTGLASAFLKAGFRECARRSETRPIMRYYLPD